MWQARVRRMALVAIDGAAAAVSVVVALFLRFDGSVPQQ